MLLIILICLQIDFLNSGIWKKWYVVIMNSPCIPIIGGKTIVPPVNSDNHTQLLVALAVFCLFAVFIGFLLVMKYCFDKWRHRHPKKPLKSDCFR